MSDLSHLPVSVEPADGSDAEKRIHVLRELVRYHQYQYYVADDPLVSDQEFDALFHELLSLEEQYPEYRNENSPTVRVGGVVSERFEKTRHPTPMLSLANAFGPDDLAAWRERVMRFLSAEHHADLD